MTKFTKVCLIILISLIVLLSYYIGVKDGKRTEVQEINYKIVGKHIEESTSFSTNGTIKHMDGSFSYGWLQHTETEDKLYILDTEVIQKGEYRKYLGIEVDKTTYDKLSIGDYYIENTN